MSPPEKSRFHCNSIYGTEDDLDDHKLSSFIECRKCCIFSLSYLDNLGEKANNSEILTFCTLSELTEAKCKVEVESNQ